jgi:hypothetical protein
MIFKKMKEDSMMIITTMIPGEKTHSSITMTIGGTKSILRTIMKTIEIRLIIIKKSGEMKKIEDMKISQIIKTMIKTIKNIQDGKKMDSKFKSKAN